MAEIKTQANEADVQSFLERVENKRRREDAFVLLEMMRRLTGEKAVMWGPSIIGFGNRHDVYESGREVDWFNAGFSPRKQNLTLYLMKGNEECQEILTRLGRHKVSKGCLYINKLADIDLQVLEELIAASYQYALSKSN